MTGVARIDRSVRIIPCSIVVGQDLDSAAVENGTEPRGPCERCLTSDDLPYNHSANYAAIATSSQDMPANSLPENTMVLSPQLRLLRVFSTP